MLISDSGTLLPWLPALMIVALCALAFAVAAMPAAKPRRRRVRIAAIAALGSAALATSVWQASAASDEIAHLKQNDQTQKLALEVKSLAEELAKLKESARARSLDDQTATKLADYLRPYGSRKIVVSCVPNDVEAYHYATELANALKGASWDALGPQTTMIFGNIRAMGINVYDTGSAGPDTAKILVDAFAKFGKAACRRPRQSTVAESNCLSAPSLYSHPSRPPSQPISSTLPALF